VRALGHGSGVSRRCDRIRDWRQSVSFRRPAVTVFGGQTHGGRLESCWNAIAVCPLRLKLGYAIRWTMAGGPISSLKFISWGTGLIASLSYDANV
jgi:hypothetical protein